MLEIISGPSSLIDFWHCVCDGEGDILREVEENSLLRVPARCCNDKFRAVYGRQKVSKQLFCLIMEETESSSSLMTGKC